jgi:hypothetical protein
MAACVKRFPSLSGDCSGFVRAVGSDVGVQIIGLANQIVDTIRAQGAWTVLTNGVAAQAEAAKPGKLVIAGLRGDEQANKSVHGHVVVIVNGPLANGKYPSSYYGSLGGTPGQDVTVNYAWTAQDRDRITYASTDITPPPTSTNSTLAST